MRRTNAWGLTLLNQATRATHAGEQLPAREGANPECQIRGQGFTRVGELCWRRTMSIPNLDFPTAQCRSYLEGAQGRSEGESREGGANLTPKTCAVRH